MAVLISALADLATPALQLHPCYMGGLFWTESRDRRLANGRTEVRVPKLTRRNGKATFMRVLFLDFDGVLHTPNCASTLQLVHLPHLLRLLREYPDVQVVVASSWRETRSLDQLRQLFPEDLRLRVVGATPFLTYEGGSGHRQRECVAWLEQHAPGSSWLALDDEAALYEPDKVLVCDPGAGLSANDVRDRLEDWLRLSIAK